MKLLLVVLATVLLVLKVHSQGNLSTDFASTREIDCYCATTSIGDSECHFNRCSITVQTDDRLMQNFFCRIDININFKEVRWICHDATLKSCEDDTGDSPVRSACCADGVFCNRCLVPPTLTYEECIQLDLESFYPRDCDFNCSSLTTQLNVFPGYLIVVCALAGLIVVLVVVMLLVFLIVYKFYKRRDYVLPQSAGSIPDMFDPSRRGIESSGGLSGGGPISLEKRHFFDDLKMEHKIGSGAMGDVWKATRFGMEMALKRSLSTQSSQNDIKREKAIFTCSRLVHPNIVSYFFSDRYIGKGNIITEEFWITMKYYRHGSLFDYLKNNSLTPDKVLTILKDLASALVYLHTPVYSINGILEQGGIAHRDLKTPNILIESLDGHCVISDFGLAVMAEDFVPPKHPIKVLVGTRRYMAPEVLTQSLNVNSLEAFMQTDIYSFGLIMWEVLQRAENKAGEANEYQQPLYEHLTRNPSIDEVRRVVVERGLRPTVEYYNESHYHTVSDLMKECWSTSPDSRPKAIRIMKKLNNISLKV